MRERLLRTLALPAVALLTGMVFVVGALSLAGLVTGCSEPLTSPTPVADPSNHASDSTGSFSVQSAKAKGGTKPKYTLAFSGDITGLKTGVPLSPNAPWRGLDVGNMTLRLPNGPLTGSGCSWGGNDGDWLGALSIRQRGVSTHLGFQGSFQGTGVKKNLNLAVNHDAVSRVTGTTFVLEFTNAQALVGATSEDPEADPCVTFTIIATRE